MRKWLERTLHNIILGPQSYHKVNDLLEKHITNLKQETEFDTISNLDI